MGRDLVQDELAALQVEFGDARSLAILAYEDESSSVRGGAEVARARDAVQGIEAARAAGMAVVALTTTRDRAALSQADMIVDGLGELKVEDFKKLLNGARQ